MSDRIPNKMPIMSDRMSNRVPNKMPTYMSQHGMSENNARLNVLFW